MAKWKNALLISTIVAPIAFGAGPVGNALADAINEKNAPAATDVTIHKYLNTDSSKGSNYFWGSGEAGTTTSNNPFTQQDSQGKNAEGWELAKDGSYQFTAYALPTDVISGYNLGDKPEISDDLIKDSFKGTPTAAQQAIIDALGDTKWSDLLEAVNNIDEKTGDPIPKTDLDIPLTDVVNSWSVVVKSGADTTALENYLKIVDSEAAGTLQEVSTTNGTATFQNLSSNEWIIFEGTHPGGEKLTKSQPMVLNLPMMQQDGTWFGDVENGGVAVNLYPKDIANEGDLKVVKTNGETGAKIDGATFIAFEAPSAENLEKLKAAIAADTDKIIEKDTADFITYIKANFGVGDDVQTKVTGAAPDASGEATFAVDPDKTYVVMETEVPTPYSEDATVHVVTTQKANPNDLDAGDDDGTVYFTGGHLDVDNWDKPDTDKTINVGKVMSDADLAAAGEDEFGVFKDNDFSVGVARGEAFQYSVDTEVNSNLASPNGYNQYSVLDTFDYQIDVTDFTIGAWNGSTYTPLVKVQLLVEDPAGSGTYVPQDTDGGFSGSYGAKYKAVYTALGSWLPSGDKVENYLTVDGGPSHYTMPTEGGGGATGTSNGTINISLNMLTGKSDFSGNLLADELVAGSQTDGASSDASAMRVIMNAQVNSAATVGTINNNAELTSQPVNGVPDKPSDSSKTFDAGWEFVKTDSGNKALQGAGFDLSRDVTENEAADFTQADRLLNQNSGIAAFLKTPAQNDDEISDASLLTDAAQERLLEMAEKLQAAETWRVTTDSDTSKLKTAEVALQTALDSLAALDPEDENYETELAAAQAAVEVAMYNVLQDQESGIKGGTTLYFAHLDEDGLPQDKMPETLEMGDVLWTVYKQFATTHLSDVTGYLQYCGLASGPYTMTESIVPDGYQKAGDIKFYLMNPAYDKTNEELTADGYTADQISKLRAQQAIDEKNYEDNYEDDYELLMGKVSSPEIQGNGQSTAEKIQLMPQIKNYEKSIFPLVGGLGTLFAVIAGLLAMGLALLKRKKDMKNEA